VLLLQSNLSSKVPKHLHGLTPSIEHTNIGFFYEKEIKTDQSELLIRPFFSKYYEKKSNATFYTSFYPLFYRQSTSKWSRWSFLFIFGGDTSLHDDLGNDEDVTLSPLFIWGNGDTDREKYFSIFPFYGSIHNKLSWSKIHFFLFPLYTSWEYKNFKATSLLWPLTMYGETDVRKEYRFLPFFSYKAHIGKYEHSSFLWPFFSWGIDNLDKKEPSSYSFFWLLFSKKESYFKNQYSIGVIPVIGSMSLFSYGYDHRTSEINFNAFFFLFQYGYNNDKDYRKLIFFPFYGYSKFANKEFLFVTPLFARMETDTYHLKSKNYYFFPFYLYNSEFYLKEERSDIYYKFWPFLKWHKDHEGTLKWNLFSIYPIRSETFEKVWDPITSLFEYSHQVNGDKKISLLMRLYNHRWNETTNQWNIPFFLDYKSEEEITQFRFFYGLIGYEKKEDKKYLQLLWFLKI
jgi:hypothetical protein